MKSKLLLAISFFVCVQIFAEEKNTLGDICEILAEQKANAKNLLGESRKKFIRAMKKTCLVNRLSNENYESDITKLTESIAILETIDGARKELIDALELRALKNTHKAYVNFGYVNTTACWDAIFDYSHLMEFGENVSFYLNRGKLYYEVDKYSKACSDLSKANSLGSREARNLMDKFDCY